MLRSLAIVFIFSSACQAAPLRVYVLAGQSNMWGHGEWSSLDTADQILPVEVPYYRPFRSGGFGYVRPISGQFGPEIRFSTVMQSRAPQPFAIVKHAIGSTTLAVDWHAHDGPRYQELLAAVNEATNYWSLQGYQPRLAGMAWMQGEHDAKVFDYAAQYEANLTDFIRAIRDDFDEPLLPFVFGRTNAPNPNFPYREMVREAQTAVDRTVPLTRLIDTDPLSLKDDLVHIDSHGLLDFGELIAEAFGSVEIPTSYGLPGIGNHHLDVDENVDQNVPEPSGAALVTLGLLAVSSRAAAPAAWRRSPPPQRVDR